MVGKQYGREVKPYITEDGSTELLFLHYGHRGPSEIFHTEHAQNKMQTWIYRMAGWFISFLGLNCIASILDIIGMYNLDTKLSRKPNYKILIDLIVDMRYIYMFFSVDDYPYARSVLVLGVTSLPFSFSISLSLLFIGKKIGAFLYHEGHQIKGSGFLYAYSL